MEILYFVVCFLASIVGAICGIGGGVIIKPALDATHTMDAVTISFMSGITVLAMTTYSVIKGQRKGEIVLKKQIGLPLAFGAASGGIIGKDLLSYFVAWRGETSQIGLVQAVCLLIITIFTFVYTIFKEKIITRDTKSVVSGVVLGILLGIMSSFLGIGGGPINIILLLYFYSMDGKQATSYSLFIIFLSQLFSLVMTFVHQQVPRVNLMLLMIMICAGICGGIIGRWIHSFISERKVTYLFMVVMGEIILLNIYNIYFLVKM